MARPDHKANPSVQARLKDTHKKTGSLEPAYHKGLLALYPLVRNLINVANVVDFARVNLQPSGYSATCTAAQ